MNKNKWEMTKIEKLKYCWCWLEILASFPHFRSSSFHHLISDFQPSQPQMCKLQQSIESSSASSLACRQQQNLAIVQFSSSFSVAASSPSVGTAHNWVLQQTKRTERNTERNSISRRIKFALKIAFRHTRRSRFCASWARSFEFLKYSCFDKLIFFWFCLLFVVAEFRVLHFKEQNVGSSGEDTEDAKKKNLKIPSQATKTRLHASRWIYMPRVKVKVFPLSLVDVNWAWMWVARVALIILIFAISRCYQRHRREFCRWKSLLD